MADTVHSHLEAIQDRHYLRVPRPFDEDSCGHCRHEWPCADHLEAGSALALLDEADVFYPTGAAYPGRHYGDPSAVHRMVYDPDVPDPRVEAEASGDTT